MTGSVYGAVSPIMDILALWGPITAAAAFVLDHPLFSLTVAISAVAIALSLVAVHLAAAIPRAIHTTTTHPAPPDDDARTRRRLHAIVDVERVTTRRVHE